MDGDFILMKFLLKRFLHLLLAVPLTLQIQLTKIAETTTLVFLGIQFQVLMAICSLLEQHPVGMILLMHWI